jgi:hypothetical protein
MPDGICAGTEKVMEKKTKGSIPKVGTFDKEFHFFLEIFVW